MIFPLTTNDVSVPTEVILGCAFVVTVPAVVVNPAVTAYIALETLPITLAPARFDNPLPLPANRPVIDVKFTEVIFPFTASDVNVPSEVILGWALVVNVPAT